MKTVYLLLAIAGTVVPYLFFLDFFVHHGVALPAFVGGLFANGAAGGFTADLLITSLVFWLYLYERGESKLWMYVLLNLTIGMSCAVPLYLYLNYDPRGHAKPNMVSH